MFGRNIWSYLRSIWWRNGVEVDGMENGSDSLPASGLIKGAIYHASCCASALIKLQRTERLRRGRTKWIRGRRRMGSWAQDATIDSTHQRQKATSFCHFSCVCVSKPLLVSIADQVSQDKACRCWRRAILLAPVGDSSLVWAWRWGRPTGWSGSVGGGDMFGGSGS